MKKEFRKIIFPAVMCLAFSLSAGNLLPERLDFTVPGRETTGGELEVVGRSFLCSDTSGGRIGNAGSVFKFVQDRNSQAVKRINAVLAKPVSAAPVEFSIGFDLEEIARASRFVSADFRLIMNGPAVPVREVMAYPLNLKDLNFAPGRTLILDGENTPVLRFVVSPSGGRNKIDSLEFLFGIRADTGSTPERWRIGNFSLKELGPIPGAKGGKNVFFSEFAPSGVLRSVLAEQGFREVRNGSAEKADLVFLSGRFDQEQNAKRYLDALKNGGIVVVDFRIPSNVRSEMAELLPVNPWSVKRIELRRPSDAVVGFPGSGLDVSAPLILGMPLDLHLPGSPMENSMNRYLWKGYEKSLCNTDWKILLTTRAGIPVLVSGKVGKAVVYVFGGDFSDSAFVSSPGYSEFCRKFAAILAARTDSLKLDSDLSFLKIEIPQVQGKELCVKVRNTGDMSLTALLSYQVSNWEREILNCSLIPVRLKAGEMKSIPIAERGAFKGDTRIREMGSSIPYRRIRAGLLGSDQMKVWSETNGLAFTGGELSLTISENSAFWPDRSAMPQTDGEYDGSFASRYVLPAGTEPELTVTVGNRFANIAPLAQSADLKWKENPTAEGLNDLSLSRADARKRGVYQGGWGARAGAEQEVALTWKMPVTIARIAIEGYGSYRREDRLNPTAFSFFDDGGRLLLRENAAEFQENGSTYYSRWAGSFPAIVLRSIRMEITAQTKNRANLNLGGTNCVMKELEVFGWPGVKGGEEVSGVLEVTMHDLLKDARKKVFSKEITVVPYSGIETVVKLPARKSFGPVRYDIVFQPRNGMAVSSHYDVLYQEPGHSFIVDKKSLGPYQPGLLCSPGWYNFDSFGRGMLDWTRGWGGPHDKIWALVHGLMETDAGNAYAPDRMFTTNTRNSHYTNPWRYLPDGSYGWDLTAVKILEEAEKRYRNLKHVHVGASDRWNGIPIGKSYGWDLFIRFDEYLRKEKGKGLEGRSFRQIANEINMKYADVWQKWQLSHYADQLLKTQKMFQEHGLGFSLETHGSFPLAGNELGEKIGRTHLGVGTDLFWELRNQDLYWSLGTRFSIVAANPDLRSGLYKQWGWINSESNAFWFSNNASVEPARRQWYSTYFVGRVDSHGDFHPYHVYGYAVQGGISTKFFRHEIANAARTLNFTAYIRPEKAVGFGLVVSWNSHENRMCPKAGMMGCGLYASGGFENQLESRMGHLYERMVKNGLPVGFVTSSHALEKWNGRNPLLILDATDWTRKELERLQKLQNSGTPLIAFAGDNRSPEAFLFWTEGAERRKIAGMEMFVRPGEGNAAPVVFCPLNAQELPAGSLREVARMLMRETGLRLDSASGMTVTPFISQDALFFAFGTQSDTNRMETVTVDPSAFLPELKEKQVRFLDMDTFEILNAGKNKDGTFTFQLPVGAVSGRLVMVKEVEE